MTTIDDLIGEIFREKYFGRNIFSILIFSVCLCEEVDLCSKLIYFFVFFSPNLSRISLRICLFVWMNFPILQIR